MYMVHVEPANRAAMPQSVEIRNYGPFCTEEEARSYLAKLEMWGALEVDDPTCVIVEQREHTRRNRPSDR